MEGKTSLRKFGTDIGIKIFYGFIRIGGQRAAYGLLYIVVFYYLIFSAKARESASHYISRRFPDASSPMRLVHTYKLILNLGQVLIDSAALSIKGTSAMNPTCPDKEPLTKLINDTISQQKGVILMISHVGCWQSALSALDFIHMPLNMLMQISPDHNNYHLLKQKSSTIKVIDADGFLGGSVDIISALGKGEGVAMMGDRISDKGNNTLKAKFLGQEARFPYGIFRIASATGAPIVVLFASKYGRADYKVELAKVIRVPRGLGRKKESYQEFLEIYVSAIELYCKKFPYQFFNFYNMWEV